MHSCPALPQADDELRLLIDPGVCVEIPGSAASESLRRQLATALAASALLEGGLVVIANWLPGLHWRIQASQQLADLLHGIKVDTIWNSIEPHLARWIEQPADADVFVLSPEWGECALVPSAYRWKSEPAAFTLRCRWGHALAHS